MFDQLNGLLGLSDSELPTGQYLTIIDVSSSLTCDASIFIHHFLHYYLKLGHSVVFLGLSQTFLHYRAVCQKRGVNCNKCRDTGQLVFIEGLKEVSGAFSSDGDSSELHFIGNPDGRADNSAGFSPLTALFQKLENHVLEIISRGEQKKLMLIIDDLNLLLDVGVALEHVMSFSHRLYALLDRFHSNVALLTSVRGSRSMVAGRLGAGSGSGEQSVDIDQSALTLTTTVCARSDIQLYVQALTTGCSKDVHGTAWIRWSEFEDIDPAKQEKVMQFKVEDRNVAFFPLGTSAAVL